MNQIPMTLIGAEKLRAELKELKTIKRPRIIAAIAEAREYGDLRENAEYNAAREEQVFCESKIQEIESKLSSAQIIDIKQIPKNSRVVFGSTVTVLNVNNNEKVTYKIVGNDEANFKQNLISVHAPIARGLIGKNINDIVVIKTPNGNVQYEILNVEYL